MAKAQNIDAKRLGVAGGLLWAIFLFVWTLIANNNGYGQGWLDLLSEIYLGYSVSTTGAFIGLLWGFVDGFIGLFLLAWLYNWLSGKI